MSKVARSITEIDIPKEIYESVSKAALIQSDFTGFSNLAEGVTVIAAGAGASSVAPTSGFDFIDHPGVWQLNTGTTAAGRVFILSRVDSLILGANLTRSGTILRTGALSTGAQRYTIRSGFYSINLPNVIIEGVGFEYNDAENGGRWQAIAHNGTETSVDTGITVAANTWYNLEFEVNAAGTSIEYFIDGVSVATIVTNIPTGTGFGLFYNTHIMKLIGTTTTPLYVDHYYIYQEVTR